MAAGTLEEMLCHRTGAIGNPRFLKTRNANTKCSVRYFVRTERDAVPFGV